MRPRPSLNPSVPIRVGRAFRPDSDPFRSARSDGVGLERPAYGYDRRELMCLIVASLPRPSSRPSSRRTSQRRDRRPGCCAPASGFSKGRTTRPAGLMRLRPGIAVAGRGPATRIGETLGPFSCGARARFVVGHRQVVEELSSMPSSARVCRSPASLLMLGLGMNHARHGGLRGPQVRRGLSEVTVGPCFSPAHLELQRRPRGQYHRRVRSQTRLCSQSNQEAEVRPVEGPQAEQGEPGGGGHPTGDRRRSPF